MKNKIRVMHVTQSAGGVKRYILNILENADSEKFEHILVCPDNDFIDYVNVNKLAEYSCFIFMKREPSIVNDLKALFKLIATIKKYRPNLIHAHSAKGGVLGRIAAIVSGVPCTFTPNGFSHLSFEGLKRKVYKVAEMTLTPLTKCLLAVGKSEAEIAKKEINYPSTKIKFVSNAIQVTTRYKVDYKFKGRIGTVGRLTPQKNPLEFLRLAKVINDSRQEKIEFLLLGAGFHDHLRNEVDDFIKENNMYLYFKILDWNEDKSIYDFMESIDIFIMTSIFEGLPFSLLEAMNFGLPCIVSNTPGTMDAVSSKNSGFVYDNFDSLLNFSNNLIESESLRRKIGVNARFEIEKNFNVKSQIPKIERIYKALI